jgi:hypothetical protein
LTKVASGLNYFPIIWFEGSTGNREALKACRFCLQGFFALREIFKRGKTHGEAHRNS